MTEEERRRRCIIDASYCPPDYQNQAQALAVDLALADGATANEASEYLTQAESLLAAGFTFPE
jgi:hypothetical protein